MDNSQKVTVDRSYFEALLRRADFNIAPQSGEAQASASSISISRAEYNSLLRTSNEHQLLKNALFQGGITEETLNTLIKGTDGNDKRKDSGCDTLQLPPPTAKTSWFDPPATTRDLPWRSGAPFNAVSNGLHASYSHPNTYTSHSHLRAPSFHRQMSYGTGLDDAGFDDEASMTGDIPPSMTNNQGERRTLYFSGLSDRTTHQDLLSVIKGGKLLSVNMRQERTATISFLDSAAEFLSWTKRNDIYLHSKRVEVKWADRQFYLNNHIKNKIANGATRNLVLRSAVEKGLSESQIRADMEHIHNLVVIKVDFRDGDAYVSMNSIYNALFARTCMMSRAAYKGSRIEFFPDECDVPLPVRTYIPRKTAPQPAKSQKNLSNRFGILDIDGQDRSSDEENRTPSEDGSDTDGGNAGINLDFLDSGST